MRNWCVSAALQLRWFTHHKMPLGLNIILCEMIKVNVRKENNNAAVPELPSPGVVTGAKTPPKRRTRGEIPYWRLFFRQWYLFLFSGHD